MFFRTHLLLTILFVFGAPYQHADSRTASFVGDLIEDSVAVSLVDEYMLKLRLNVQARDFPKIANLFFHGFVFHSCEAGAKVYGIGEVASFLTMQNNVMARPFTVSKCKRHYLNLVVSFNLEFPSLFNGTALVTLIPMNNYFVASSAFAQC